MLCFLKLLIKAIKYPKAIKAPGANTKTNMPYSSGRILKLKILPVPKNSLTAPKRVNAIVNPKPIPKPSNKEANGLFFAAKASARPSNIQFTTINGINKPKVAYKAGTKACITICNNVTKEAITTTKAGIRTMSGMRF